MKEKKHLKVMGSEDQRWNNFSASSYQRYQGYKLRKRFSALSYHYLSKAMDSHNLGRHFNSIEDALLKVKAEALVIGVDTDILFPITEQKLLNKYLQHSQLEIIASIYGHDGFLVETEAISSIVSKFLYKA